MSRFFIMSYFNFIFIFFIILLSSCSDNNYSRDFRVLFSPEEFYKNNSIDSLGIPNDISVISSYHSKDNVFVGGFGAGRAYRTVDSFSLSSGYFIYLSQEEIDVSTINADSIKFYLVNVENRNNLNYDYRVSFVRDEFGNPKQLDYIPFSSNSLLKKDGFTVRFVESVGVLQLFPTYPLKKNQSYMVVFNDKIKDKAGSNLQPSLFFDESVINSKSYPDHFLESTSYVLDQQYILAKSDKNQTGNIVHTAVFTTSDSGFSINAVGKKIVSEDRSSIVYKDNNYYLKTDSFLQLEPLKDSNKNNCDMSQKSLLACADLINNYWSSSNTGLESLIIEFKNASDEEKKSLYNQFKKCSKSKSSLENFINDYSVLLKSGKISNCQFVLNGEPIDKDRHITADNPYPESSGVSYLPLLYKQAKKNRKEEAFILVHGLTGSKEDLEGLSYSLVKRGYDTFAIDLSMHGSRLDNYFPQYKKASSSPYSIFAFINLVNKLCIRDNIRQSVVDLIALRAAISKLETSTGNKYKKVHLSSLSLGSIVSLSLNGFFARNSGDPSIPNIDSFIHFAPGIGASWFLISSPSYGVIVQNYVRSYYGLSAEYWSEYKDSAILEFSSVVSSIIDVSESVGNFSLIKDTPNEARTMIIEMKGDNVIPNFLSKQNIFYNPLSGTRPIPFVLDKATHHFVAGGHSYMVSAHEDAVVDYILPFVE